MLVQYVAVMSPNLLFNLPAFFQPLFHMCWPQPCAHKFSVAGVLYAVAGQITYAQFRHMRHLHILPTVGLLVQARVLP